MYLLGIKSLYLPCFTKQLLRGFSCGTSELKKIGKLPLLCNDQIRFPKIRLVDSTNFYIGDLSSVDALKLAKSKRLDLILLSATAVPPLCMIESLSEYINSTSEQSTVSFHKELNTTLVGFDPGRPTKFIYLNVKSDEADFTRKVSMARKLLAMGRQTNVIIQRDRTDSLPLVIQKIQKIVIQLKDLGLANRVPHRTSDIRDQLCIELKFKPSIRRTTTPVELGIKPMICDDYPVVPELVERKKLLMDNRKHKAKHHRLLKDHNTTEDDNNDLFFYG